MKVLKDLLVLQQSKLITGVTYTATNLLKRPGSDKHGSHTLVAATVIGGSGPHNCTIKFFGAVTVDTKVKVECKCNDFKYNTIELPDEMDVTTTTPNKAILSSAKPMAIIPPPKPVVFKPASKEFTPYLCKHLITLARACLEAEVVKQKQVSDKKPVNISNRLKKK